MHILSNPNDLAGLWISLAMVGGATILLVLLWRKRSPVIVQSLGISTRSYWFSLLGTALWMSVVFLFLQPDYIPWGAGTVPFPVRSVSGNTGSSGPEPSPPPCSLPATAFSWSRRFFFWAILPGCSS